MWVDGYTYEMYKAEQERWKRLQDKIEYEELIETEEEWND